MLLSECKLEAVAHRREEMLRKVIESTSVSDAVTVCLSNFPGHEHKPAFTLFIPVCLLQGCGCCCVAACGAPC